MLTDFPKDFPYDLHSQNAKQARAEGDLLRAALWDLISTVEATGGVVEDAHGNRAPVADVDWIDLGEAYLTACEAVGHKLLLTKAEQENPDAEAPP